MANRIKGITVEINGDTTKLSKALEGVNKNIKSTQTQLKDIEKLLKLDPSNTELLSQKHYSICRENGRCFFVPWDWGFPDGGVKKATIEPP